MLLLLQLLLKKCKSSLFWLILVLILTLLIDHLYFIVLLVFTEAIPNFRIRHLLLLTIQIHTGLWTGWSISYRQQSDNFVSSKYNIGWCVFLFWILLKQWANHWHQACVHQKLAGVLKMVSASPAVSHQTVQMYNSGGWFQKSVMLLPMLGCWGEMWDSVFLISHYVLLTKKCVYKYNHNQL